MKKIILALILLIPLNSFAFDKWSYTDYTLQGSYYALIFIDWRQTMNMSDEKIETNPFLPEKPTKEQITKVVFATIITHTIISAVLPSKYRTIWQSITIGSEITATYYNYYAGYKFYY